MRQKRVLLAFVETVHLVDKDDGAFAGPVAEITALPLPDAGLLDRLADFLDAAEYR